MSHPNQDNSDNKSDKMSSVSNCSNFSLKSQQYIAKQDGQMAVMRKAMIAAGLDPDLVLADEQDLTDAGVMDVDVDTSSKKRLPSGSPSGKHYDITDSDGDEEEDGLNDSQKSKEEWKLEKRGGKKSKIPTKREQKRLRRLVRAKTDKMEADKLPQENDGKTKSQITTEQYIFKI